MQCFRDLFDNTKVDTKNDRSQRALTSLSALIDNTQNAHKKCTPQRAIDIYRTTAYILMGYIKHGWKCPALERVAEEKLKETDVQVEDHLSEFMQENRYELAFSVNPTL